MVVSPPSSRDECNDRSGHGRARYSLIEPPLRRKVDRILEVGESMGAESTVMSHRNDNQLRRSPAAISLPGALIGVVTPSKNVMRRGGRDVQNSGFEIIESDQQSIRITFLSERSGIGLPHGPLRLDGLRILYTVIRSEQFVVHSQSGTGDNCIVHLRGMVIRDAHSPMTLIP
jgi:hypothetical protein